MSDIYWAAECVDTTPERAEIFNKSNDSKEELQFYFADETDEELRTTKLALQNSLRSLWLTRVKRASERQILHSCFWHSAGEEWQGYHATQHRKWKWVEQQCREKAAEYK